MASVSCAGRSARTIEPQSWAYGALRVYGLRYLGLENEAIYGEGEAFLLVAGGDEICAGLDLGACIAHGDAEAAFFEHEDVVGHIAEGGDLFGGHIEVRSKGG